MKIYYHETSDYFVTPLQIMAESEEGLQSNLKVSSEAMDRWDLKVN